MDKLLILGKNSKLGRALSAYWLESPPEGLALAWAGREALQPSSEKADVVLALWGVTSGEAAALAENAALAEAAIDLAKALGAKRVIHLSSAAVYGAAEGFVSEDCPLAAVRPYAQAKADMEARITAASGGIENIILRLCNVAGADSLFKALAHAGPTTLDRFDGGGGPERSYIAVPELAQVFETLARAQVGDVPPVLNVAAPEPVAMEAIARAAEREVIWRDAPQGAIARVALDTARLQSIVAMPTEACDAAHLVQSWRRWGGWGDCEGAR